MIRSGLAARLLLGVACLVPNGLAEAAAPGARRPLPSPEEIAKLPPDGGPEWNRLVFESSPYLLQHAANPVDWFPWGEEAFERARAEDKPVFLSVGYSTCHWCHVMEHESFEDEEVAELLNEGFVCVKVDREERPDVDQVYMEVTQAMNRRGGWPMTVVMTPDRKPFFTGTYFPKSGRFGRPGMMQLVPELARRWREDRDAVLAHADQIVAGLVQRAALAPGEVPGEETLDLAFRQLSQRFDPERGGFSQAPKFPVPHNLRFLLRYWHRTGNELALEMVEKTLDEMGRGGIWDHVGFGFHRYSTDEEWLVPHFEKMLYDQALLAMAYLEAHQITGKPEYEATARGILRYVLRDLTSPEGGFYSAEDADSEGEEGKFYLWRPEQVVEVLGPEEGRLFCEIHDITEEGNFRDPHSGKTNGIARLKRPLGELSRERGVGERELRDRLETSRQRLFEAREKRIHPLKDDKILTDWNGLMIAAFALGARSLEDAEYEKAAVAAADFVLERLRGADGRLLKRYRAGEAGLVATLEDYAFLLWGLTELYETTFDVRYLEEAVDLAGHLPTHYADESSGGFFLGPSDGEELPIRAKESYDGAIPSGNSVAALALLRLARFTGDPGLELEAEGVFRAYSSTLRRGPSVHAQMLSALDFAIGPSYEVVIAGSKGGADTRALLRALQRPFFPNKVVILKGEEAERLTAIAEYTGPIASLDGRAAAYVCRDFACQAPTTDVDEMVAALLPSD